MIPVDALPELGEVGLYALLGVTVLVGSAVTSRLRGGSSDAPSHDMEVINGLDKGTGVQFARYGKGEGRSKSLIRAYLRRRKKEKALKKGCVRWHLVGASFSAPMYVKPEAKEGGNVAEIEYEGNTYLFPKEAMVPAEEEGVPTIVHREGEADPINLRDEWDLAIGSNTLKEYLTLRIMNPKPSGLGSLLGGLDSMDILRYGIIGLVVLFIAMEFLG
jgi:hypothetical protein